MANLIGMIGIAVLAWGGFKFLWWLERSKYSEPHEIASPAELKCVEEFVRDTPLAFEAYKSFLKENSTPTAGALGSFVDKIRDKEFAANAEANRIIGEV